MDELLKYEVNRSILQRVHDIGRENTMGSSRDSWYMDVVAATCFGTCSGTAIYFKLAYEPKWAITCYVELSDKGNKVTKKIFPAGEANIFDWFTEIVQMQTTTSS
ncbi:7866_t:CDS:2 [Acaulospora colombiana]|uniref:7866_t:CDS:1 n=1 Tax=Acaulospora colombiana TaxID=27376 RepID=A0ACA9R0W4_9GLOM|nr:7866_t:CDS:2 [Acaulospora colombiana]